MSIDDINVPYLYHNFARQFPKQFTLNDKQGEYILNDRFFLFVQVILKYFIRMLDLLNM